MQPQEQPDTWFYLIISWTQHKPHMIKTMEFQSDSSHSNHTQCNLQHLCGTELIRQFHTVWNEVSVSKRQKQTRIINQCKQSKIGPKKVTWENQYHVRGVEERRKVYTVTTRWHEKTIWKNSECCCCWRSWTINHYFSFLTLVFTCDWAGCKSDRSRMQQCFRVKQQKLKAVKKLKVFHWCGLYLLRASSGMSGWISLAQFTLEMEKMTKWNKTQRVTLELITMKNKKNSNKTWMKVVLDWADSFIHLLNSA